MQYLPLHQLAYTICYHLHVSKILHFIPRRDVENAYLPKKLSGCGEGVWSYIYALWQPISVPLVVLWAGTSPFLSFLKCEFLNSHGQVTSGHNFSGLETWFSFWQPDLHFCIQISEQEQHEINNCIFCSNCLFCAREQVIRDKCAQMCTCISIWLQK